MEFYDGTHLEKCFQHLTRVKECTWNQSYENPAYYYPSCLPEITGELAIHVTGFAPRGTDLIVADLAYLHVEHRATSEQ